MSQSSSSSNTIHSYHHPPPPTTTIHLHQQTPSSITTIRHHMHTSTPPPIFCNFLIANFSKRQGVLKGKKSLEKQPTAYLFYKKEDFLTRTG
ncbi:unnamed protein product [Lactuca virosa]|uniref:Uncharacterized protein n=1 Tax=Lactuca virosa TaxID=75947 RepID=A0AAU9M088_9ASTR|nr:unnamed protein product [Lactuca virosa]